MKNSFCRFTNVLNGTAETIVSRVRQIYDDLLLDLQKLCGLGSDGASVMLGVHGEIQTYTGSIIAIVRIQLSVQLD